MKCSYCGSPLNIPYDKDFEKRTKIFEEIAAERKQQDKSGGEQDYPMVAFNSAQEYFKQELPVLKELNRTEGYKSWFTILNEKKFEAFAETDPVKQREKMIKACAVNVQIVEYLDRQIKGSKDV